MTCFDAHLYEAGWGSLVLMFAFPREAVSVEQVQAYQVEAESEYETGLMVMERDDRVIVTFASHREEYDASIDEVDSGSWLSSMMALRSDIVSGDLRAPYLGWLAGATASFDAFVATDDLARAGRERAAELARRARQRQERDRARHGDATEG